MLAHLQYWGLIDYKEAWDRQEVIFANNVYAKLQIRKGELSTEQAHIENHLVFCEHPHVYTLGKSGSIEHLLITNDQLRQIGATYYAINRGGDITYHGPGQLVMYPIIDLEQWKTDIHLYLRTLEDAVIATLHTFGIKGERLDGYTGVWIDAHNMQYARKICAMGVRCSRWITMHGIAFNINTDLNYFSHIVPCGIEDKQVTSMSNELKQHVDMMHVTAELTKQMELHFGMQWL